MINRLRHFFKINWYETLKINLKVFDINDAFRLPIVVYHGYRIKLSGKIVMNTIPRFGTIVFGMPYEIFKVKKGSGEANILGTLIVNGKIQFGLDTKLFIKKEGIVELGHINSFASRTEIICFKSIIIKDWVQFGNDCLITDSNFHHIKDTLTQSILPMNKDILIGSYNYIGARTTIKGNTQTPHNCLVGTNSLLNKNYLLLGENILIGGIPAKKIKGNITRDWETEKEGLENYLTIKL